MLTQDSFTVGGEKLKYPGDAAGSAWNVINCRCTTLPVIDDEVGVGEADTEFTAAQSIEEAYEMARRRGINVGGRNAQEIVDLMAESHQREFGRFATEAERRGFYNNWMPIMEQSIAPADFQRDVINAMLEEIEAGRADPFNVVIHAERPGYNDRWVEAQRDPGLIRFIHHSDRRLKYKGLSLGDTLGTVSEAYENPYGGIYVHEWGHEWSYSDPSTLRRASSILDDNEDLIKRGISRYAISNSRELAAEAYAMRQHPEFDSLAESVKSLILEILGE